MTKEELYKKIENQKKELSAQERNMLYMQGKEVDCLPYSLLSHEALADMGVYSRRIKTFL